MAEILKASENRYRGKWITVDDLPDEKEIFIENLAHSVNHWRKEGIKVIWLTLPEKYHDFIAAAVSQGFTFHHISHREGPALILTKRLVERATIPEFANHTVGVGGIVLNSRDEVLSVVEMADMKSSPERFKFPGGAVDRGEHLAEAVIREVREETGIESDFVGVVGFRHYHKGQFATSNFYILCLLKAVTETIIPCPEEIGRAEWLSCETFLNKDSVMPFNKKILQAALSGNYFQLTDIDFMMGMSPSEYEVFSGLK